MVTHQSGNKVHHQKFDLVRNRRLGRFQSFQHGFCQTLRISQQFNGWIKLLGGFHSLIVANLHPFVCVGVFSFALVSFPVFHLPFHVTLPRLGFPRESMIINFLGRIPLGLFLFLLILCHFFFNVEKESHGATHDGGVFRYDGRCQNGHGSIVDPHLSSVQFADHIGGPFRSNVRRRLFSVINTAGFRLSMSTDHAMQKGLNGSIDFVVSFAFFVDVANIIDHVFVK
mmetsp:Transcript_1659/g.3087  ORF Transcript_1659/g.3087 Transcript_1659/m.3087 type:complete len:227 (+) Transcript_1659:1376-2056(+)